MTDPCPRAKLLAGAWMCPCHGTSPVQRRKKATTTNRTPGGPRADKGKKRRSREEEDEMMAQLVRVLEDIATRRGVAV